MTTFTPLKAHPYANQFPMLSDEEIASLAESIAQNGQRNPIVLTTDGEILDGRNRYAACQMAGVEPETVTYEGTDLAEYVIDSNVARRNMTTGARAMSTALVLAADGRREGGRWRRGSVQVGNSESANSGWKDRLKEAGIVLDYKPDLAPAVVAGELRLDAAFKAAQAVKDQAESAAAREAREAEAEGKAQEFIESRDPELAAKVGGDVVSTYREAVAIWEQRNAEEVRLRKQAEADERDYIERAQGRIVAFLNGWPTAARLREHPKRDAVLAALAPHYRDTFLQIESAGFTWTSTD